MMMITGMIQYSVNNINNVIVMNYSLMVTTTDLIFIKDRD